LVDDGVAVARKVGVGVGVRDAVGGGPVNGVAVTGGAGVIGGGVITNGVGVGVGVGVVGINISWLMTEFTARGAPSMSVSA